ncbi:MAG: acyl-CoA thioesterase [Candidatus Nanopelagicus sp.]|jgi:acyl-CoA thioester hydrolase|nr:acyl-CoA thioesterase [Candidatus Nanopelagicus sp.]
MKFTHKAFVRWNDLDAFGHVNNAKYLTYAESARIDWGQQQFAEKSDSVLVQMTVARSEIDYLLPITEFESYYDVDLWVESIGNSSFVVGYEVSKDGLVFTKMKTVQVMIDLESRKSRPITDNERSFLTKYLVK